MIRRDYEGGMLLIPQTAHAWVSGQMALRWGNQHFARPEPWDELVLAAMLHDNGWAEWELAPRVGPDGQPVDFMEMELEEQFAVWQRSAERMQPTSLYGALLISMHATNSLEWRLAHDKQGDSIEMRARIRGFVDEQLGFQERLRRPLADHPRYGPALEARSLLDSLRLLQIWDLLSLHLLLGPLSPITVEDVPMRSGERGTLQIAPRDAVTLTVGPYPFNEAPFSVHADGRWLAQDTFRHNALFRRALEEAQLITLDFSIDRFPASDAKS
jgi:hypothetical protein